LTIDPNTLTTLGLWTLQEISFRIYLGFTEREIAIILELPLRTIRLRQDQLRSELTER
jgi:DNA-directed RNA polymerase specialized sigma24 family protein